MRRTRALLTLIIVVTGLATGCSKEVGKPEDNPGNQGNDCDGINATFTSDIFPLIQARCATGSGCHGAGSFNGPGALTNFNQIRNAAGNIKNAVLSGRMPLGGTLTTTQIKQISCWVSNGTPDN